MSPTNYLLLGQPYIWKRHVKGREHISFQSFLIRLPRVGILSSFIIATTLTVLRTGSLTWGSSASGGSGACSSAIIDASRVPRYWCRQMLKKYAMFKKQMEINVREGRTAGIRFCISKSQEMNGKLLYIPGIWFISWEE